MDFFDRNVKIPFSKREITVKYALLHAAYWIFITGFFIYEKRYLIYKASMPYFVICVVGRILMLIVIAYLNLHYFLPNLLLKKRYGLYVTAVFLSILGYLLMQSLFDFYLYGYVIGPMRNSNWIETLSYNFFSTLWYVGLMLALKLSLDWYEQQRILQKITVEKLQAEVNFLRSQVNPHFLFNVLNNLYALTLKKSDLAPDVVLKLSEMMEYMLYDSDNSRVLLQKEIGYLNTYLELEKLRFGDHSDIILNVSGDVNGQVIAPLLLLPLVENAMKHGVSQQNGTAWLHGDLRVNKSSLKMDIENSKPAIHVPVGKGGIGLDNLRKRLELLYPAKHTLKTQDKGNSFLVNLEIEF
ncbi:sensor histidine kinase [Dyadobacter psychrophilus]|uniref:Histidine kinase n=1 Tax=Dyadobacter psychrophilus TaxID=651661 RepID=A0A1T5EB60_9BACT|nr:histidine kinase [Dyadobacter psychrophilus]SKB80925.1 Histidine kinase [Dyadobacter psychrophilus]